MQNFGKLNSLLSNHPSRIRESFGRLEGLENIEYCINFNITNTCWYITLSFCFSNKFQNFSITEEDFLIDYESAIDQWDDEKIAYLIKSWENEFKSITGK